MKDIFDAPVGEEVEDDEEESKGCETQYCFVGWAKVGDGGERSDVRRLFDEEEAVGGDGLVADNGESGAIGVARRILRSQAGQIY